LEEILGKNRHRLEMFRIERTNIKDNRYNTLKLALRGCVWVRFVSPFDHPLARIKCHLTGGGRDWPVQKTSDEGDVFWNDLPLDEYYVELRVGDRFLEVQIPWLREKYSIHYERLLDAFELIGPDDSPHGIQIRLLGLGYNPGQVDGVIGKKTEKAMKQFQADRGLNSQDISWSESQEILADIYGA